LTKFAIKFCSGLKRLALSLFLLLSSILHVPLTAQGNATVHGRIIDSLSQKPIAFAVIALQKPGDEFPSSTLSNDSGMFRVNLPDTGTYKVIITLLGYKTITNENIVVHGELDLGTILFAHDSHYLDATTIVAQQDIVENTPDMVIYHADKDVTTEGSTAIDLLKKVPGVTVDINGNIELMGSSGLRIFINGKPSVLMASHPVDVLQAIPADQIKSIEIISNPSAKYDAQGTGGIINIVLKKNVLPGVNGNISGTIGSRIEQGNATISYEHDDFSVSADLGGNYYIPQDGSSSFTRTATVNDTTGNLIQNGTTNSGRQNYYPTIELGWELGDNDEISASVGYEDFRNDGTSVTDVNTFSDPGNDSVFLRKTGSNRTNETSLEYNVDYSHTFDTLGKELDLSMEFSGDRDSSDYRTDQSFLHSSQPIDPSSYEFSQLENDLGKEAEYLFTADLILPFDEDHTLEFGGKANIYNVSSVYSYFNRDSTGNYVLDPTQSNSFVSNQNVFAAYTLYSFKLKKFTIKPGVRYEQTISDNHLENSDSHYKQNYGTLAPSLAVFRKYGRNIVKLNYSRRIERPEYDEMNPFVNTSDRFNITMGNTRLVPEQQHRVEVSWSTNTKNGLSFSSTLFCRRQTKDIQNYTTFYSTYIVNADTFTDVSVGIPMNIVSRFGTGGNIFASWSYKDKFSLRANLMGSREWLENTMEPDSPTVKIFRYSVNMNLSVNLPWKITAELFGVYHSHRYTLQGYRPAYYEYSFGMKKVFDHGKASIGLSATDWLRKDFEFHSHVSGNGFTQENISMIPIRSVGVTFSWRFGKMQQDDQQMDDNGNPLFQK
jgi:hypothetical protein